MIALDRQQIVTALLDDVEGVLRGDAVLEHEEAAQSVILEAALQRHVVEIVGIGEYGADGDYQDLPEIVLRAIARSTRVFDLVQAVHQAHPGSIHFVVQKTRVDALFGGAYKTAT